VLARIINVLLDFVLAIADLDLILGDGPCGSSDFPTLVLIIGAGLQLGLLGFFGWDVAGALFEGALES
jgi:hypothetical protein